RRRRKQFSFFKDIGIPGPRPSLFSGNLSELIDKGTVLSFDVWGKKYGDLVGFYNGAEPMLIVKDLELIKRIQIKDFSNFRGRGISSLMDTCTDEFLEVLDSLHDQDEAFEIRQVFQKLSMD
ncbi:unnamed protein product, partial [Ixodes persulcatus]